jgi:hypothetical protein
MVQVGLDARWQEAARRAVNIRSGTGRETGKLFLKSLDRTASSFIDFHESFSRADLTPC